MPTTPPPSGDPHARGSVLHGFRAALLDLWGESAVDALAARLPHATRVATVERLILPFEWVALEHVVAWHDALWTGPCAGDEATLARVLGRAIELGVGRVRSAFFAGATPERLVERAPELWRWQHTHGQLSASLDGPGGGLVVLRDHPYVDHALSRRLTAESYRQVVTLVGGRDVRAAWGDRGGAAPRSRELVVHLSWRVQGD